MTAGFCDGCGKDTMYGDVAQMLDEATPRCKTCGPEPLCTCYGLPDCPDRVRCRPAAASTPSGAGNEQGAAATFGSTEEFLSHLDSFLACRCYPANKKCPTEAACERWEDVRDGHVTYPSGMVRGDDSGKPDYTLVDLPLLERWARLMTEQAPVKGRDNWRLAHTPEDRQRFVASAWRHLIAWSRGDSDEDHAAAIVFNVAGAEHVRRTV